MHHSKPYPAPYCQSTGESDSRMLIIYGCATAIAISAVMLAGVIVYFINLIAR
jgi:hypothetical protein